MFRAIRDKYRREVAKIVATYTPEEIEHVTNQKRWGLYLALFVGSVCQSIEIGYKRAQDWKKVDELDEEIKRRIAEMKAKHR